MSYTYSKTVICRSKDTKDVLTNLKRIMFPVIEENKISSLMIDEDSISYITYSESAQEITNVIMNNLVEFPCPITINEDIWCDMTLYNRMKHLVITDMTAGVGGNVLNFSRFFKYVNAIEINKTRCDYLKHNIDLYNFINVNCYCGDSINILINDNQISQDIVFFDPPWGGRQYKNYENLKLYFKGEDDTSTGISVENIVQCLLEKGTKMVVAKLPKNYDFVYFEETLLAMNLQNSSMKISCCNFMLDRMSIMIVKNY